MEACPYTLFSGSPGLGAGGCFGTYRRCLPVIRNMLTHKIAASILLSVVLALLVLTPAQAQYGAPKIATVTATAKPGAVARGGKGILLVTVSVSPQFHINAHQPNDPAYIATVFSGQSSGGVTFGAAKYPAPKAMKLSYANKPLLVYTGRTVIAVPFTVAKTAKPGKTTLAGTLSFQGCDAKSCYPPASAQVRTVVTVK